MSKLVLFQCYIHLIVNISNNCMSYYTCVWRHVYTSMLSYSSTSIASESSFALSSIAIILVTSSKALTNMFMSRLTSVLVAAGIAKSFLYLSYAALQYTRSLTRLSSLQNQSLNSVRAYGA